MKTESRNVILSQKVSNPVGSDDNTDIASDDVGNVTSGNIELVPGVCNPVGSSLNTDKGAHQTPLPMRPIPS